MSSSSFQDMWFSSHLGYLYKIWVTDKRFPLVMKTPTCIHSIKHLSTKSRDYHFPKRLKVAQWCSLKSRTSLSSVYFSWNTAETTMWKKDRQWKAVKKGHLRHKISLTMCRWSFIFSTKFFKLVLSDDFTRLGSSRRFVWPALSTSFKWQNWSKILKGEHYPKRHWDFSLNSFLLSNISS